MLSEDVVFNDTSTSAISYKKERKMLLMRTAFLHTTHAHYYIDKYHKSMVIVSSGQMTMNINTKSSYTVSISIRVVGGAAATGLLNAGQLQH